MIKPIQLRVVVAIFAVTIICQHSIAQGTVRSYRYSLNIRSQEGEFSTELPPSAKVGGRFDVETGADGRRIRVSYWRNGQKLSEELFRFEGNAKLPSGYEKYQNGEKTGITHIQRDAAGQRIRQEFLTANGNLTQYGLYSYFSDRVEYRAFTAEGKASSTTINYYSANERRVRAISYLNPDDKGLYIEATYDENTGLVTSGRQFEDGKLVNKRRFAYDAAGDRVRQDSYNPDDTWYAAEEYSDGLATKRIGKYDNKTREWRYVYDEKRWLKESSLYVNGALTCRLVYDRFSDGTAKRTMALGPNGDLWAEYPDRIISDLKKNGEALDGKTSVIHKKGDWW